MAPARGGHQRTVVMQARSADRSGVTWPLEAAAPSSVTGGPPKHADREGDPGQEPCADPGAELVSGIRGPDPERVQLRAWKRHPDLALRAPWIDRAPANGVGVDDNVAENHGLAPDQSW